MISNDVLWSIIVPTYNEATAIADSLETILRTFAGERYEIVVVDDGSSDGTAVALDRFRDRPRLTIVRHSKNRGKGAALRTGIAHAGGSVIAFCDSDLELDPRDLRRLIELLVRDKRRVVYGQRRFPSAGGLPALTYNAGNRFLNLVGNLLFHGHVVDMECGYKVFLGSTIRALSLRCCRFDIEPEITYALLARGIPIGQFPIDYRPRTHALGKKIRVRDGLAALLTMIRMRMTS